MKKAIWILLVALLFLAGCSAGIEVVDTPSKSPVSEKDLLSYVADWNPIFMTDIEYSSVTVEKRKTDEDEGTDTVWVKIEGSNSTDAVEASGIMEFSLYNDGWRLDDVDIEEKHYYPLAGPSDYIIQDCLGASFEYYQYDVQSIDLDAGIATYYYRGLIEYPYMDKYNIGTASFKYMYGGYWQYTGMDATLEDEFWQRIEGIWSGRLDYSRSLGPEIYRDFTIRIDDIKEGYMIGQYLIHSERRDDSSYDWSDSGTIQLKSGQNAKPYDIMFADDIDWALDVNGQEFYICHESGLHFRKNGSVFQMNQDAAFEEHASIYNSLFSGELDDNISADSPVLTGYYSK